MNTPMLKSVEAFPLDPLARFLEQDQHTYLADETDTVQSLMDLARTDSERSKQVSNTARQLVTTARTKRQQSSGLQAFLQHYDLSSEEGVVLMCVAEALLRIPDTRTMDALIADKLSSGDWQKHLGSTDSAFVNATTWALMLTGKVMQPTKLKGPEDILTRMLARMEEPLLRTAMKTAMRIMARQFVMGRNIEEALERSTETDNRVWRYSFDMLGEAALTKTDAAVYFNAYADAIKVLGERSRDIDSLMDKPGISIKLSALCPRYHFTQWQGALSTLSKQLLALAKLAKQANISLTVDAEEADRLSLSLAIFNQVYLSSELGSWEGLGLAVQTYQKRALAVLHYLNALSRQAGRVIPVRLVKGAYWDTEIKLAQEQGLENYPVFTCKSNTDVSYLACARYILEQAEKLYPQFASHNAHTIAYLYQHARHQPFEFQRLHGMGEELYTQIIGRQQWNIPCRVYAPVGAHEDLLPYLVRRLLENGANTSFVNQLVDDASDIDVIIADPVTQIDNLGHAKGQSNVPLPAELFGSQRQNSAGMNFADKSAVSKLLSGIEQAAEQEWIAGPILNGKHQPGVLHVATNPASGNATGHISHANEDTIRKAITIANEAFPIWNATPAQERARILEKAATLFEQHQSQLAARCVKEAGKTLIDTQAEIREAVDFLRYYAVQARAHFAAPMTLPGPTGERNELRLQGRGVFLCISPWNFPLAIFTGQVAAALAAGNTVLAKPAGQTSLIAHYATELLLKAGIPAKALQFLPGSGRMIGDIALPDPRIAGVALTGSTDTAMTINKTLAARQGPIASLIAETGGQNVMIVDSSALPEQVVMDVVQSAFNSAGQRCSALRVLYLQEEIAPRVLDLLCGHMSELVIGDPIALSTDVGPVIDASSKQTLEAHIQSFSKAGKVIYQCALPDHCRTGSFVAPTVIEIDGIHALDDEHFGPVLHVVPYAEKNLENVIDAINTSGYGLTLGIHSRIETRAEYIRQRVQVGNVYVNRNMIGAVVGVQPFGGCGLSGTGPKAGGPHYLYRFANEQTCTVNTAAIGGNASLINSA